MNAKNKESLLEESFCGTSVIVPELERALYLKEDGKKSWKRRYFLLRASGIYYVPKGKTKTSRDLACFIQFENVNIYCGIQCKMKYKAPTDYCFVLKHPQIQKESQCIKYLCCDDARTLNQWVMGIRIAKYGKTLYDNYQRAVARAGLASRWTNLGTVNTGTPDPPSTGLKAGPAQPNGQISQAAPSVMAVLEEAQRHVETTKDRKPAMGTQGPGTPRAHHLPKASLPPPPPVRRSSDTGGSPVMLPKARAAGTGGFLALPEDCLPPLPPPPEEEEELPPPPPPGFHPGTSCPRPRRPSRATRAPHCRRRPRPAWPRNPQGRPPRPPKDLPCPPRGRRAPDPPAGKQTGSRTSCRIS